MKTQNSLAEIAPSPLMFSASSSAASSKVTNTSQPAAGLQRNQAGSVPLPHPGVDSRTAPPLPAVPRDSVPPAIDEWLRRNGLNEYGDSRDIVYVGGSPLFYQRTGVRMSRLDYILKKHPHLSRLLPGGCVFHKHPFSIQPPSFPPMPPQPMPLPGYPRTPGLRGLYDMVRQLIEMVRGLINRRVPQPGPLPIPMPLPAPLAKPMPELTAQPSHLTK